MKKIFLTIAIFSTVNNLVFSQEEQDTVSEKDNMKTVLHIHPLSSLGLWFYLTIEKPLSLSNSLIIKPSFWIDPLNASFFTNGEFIEIERMYGVRIGSDIGLRHYPSGNGEGFYLQGQGGMFFTRIAEGCYCSPAPIPDGQGGYYFPEFEKQYKNYLGGDVMFYLGFSKKYRKVSWFFDFGVGVGNSVAIDGITFIPGINFGLGLKF